ncbi:MAG: AAA family ATPase [Bacillota bacterium]
MILNIDQHYYEGGQYVWSSQRQQAVQEASLRLLLQVLQHRTVSQITMMVGLPGSGKSSYAEVYDRDDVVILDGTFVDPQSRATFLAAARQAKVPLAVVWMDTDWEVCYRRNLQRNPAWRVPEGTMAELRQQLRAHPPTTEEGFEVRRVHTCLPAAA